MRRFGRWMMAILAVLVGLVRRARKPPGERGDRERIVPEGSADRRSENIVIVLLLLATLAAVAFIVIYATGGTTGPLSNKPQLLGVSMGLCLAFIAAALMLIGRRLVVTEEIEEDYPEPEHPQDQEKLTQLVEESGSRFTRKRLIIGAGGAAATGLGLAAIAPAVSFGPVFSVDRLVNTPWRRGRRLVTEDGRPYRASDILEETFYTAFPEGADLSNLGSSLVVVRMRLDQLNLPAGRPAADWAPEGILAYSKICTHAGCAIELYRKPTFPEVEPKPALVCPCHYSTFDPSDGGSVEFGPAGRGLPQLPLMIDAVGDLRANGNFSGPIGPSWWGVRMYQPKTS